MCARDWIFCCRFLGLLCGFCVFETHKSGVQLLRSVRVGAVLRAPADHGSGGVRLLLPAVDLAGGRAEHS